MRNGDREASAQFITGYDNRIRRRIRGKLNPAMRRLFDSQDILSTVGRRLDQYVSAGNLEAESERQLWALVFRMAMNAVIDKSRMYRRLQQAEGPDSMVAQEILRRLRHADQKSHAGFEVELELALNMFSDKIDREILFQWLNGFRLNEIARSIDMAPTGVRKRWQKIRERLQERFQFNPPG
jgi:DNA-directed RNA polymerase specialized sigma24 family protein